MNNYNLSELLDTLLYKTTAFRELNESDSELWWYSKDNITHYLLDDNGIYYGYFNEGGINIKIPLSVVNMKVTKTIEIDLKAI